MRWWLVQLDGLGVLVRASSADDASTLAGEEIDFKGRVPVVMQLGDGDVFRLPTPEVNP